MARFFQVVEVLLNEKDAEITKLHGERVALRVKYDRLCIQVATFVDCMHKMGDLIPMLEKMMHADDMEEEEADELKNNALSLLGEYKQLHTIVDAAEKMGKPVPPAAQPSVI